MRTNSVIDDKLLRDTLRATSMKPTARRSRPVCKLLRLKRQERIRKLRGKLHWEGDLDAMRHHIPSLE